MSISIDLARRILEASKQRARELGSPVSIAIVDGSGHLVLFERMMSPYGWATANISIAKASTAVMFNQSTNAVAQWGSGIPGFASSMASMMQGKFIMAAGGWPIRVGSATVGGIGISGGNAPGRDDEIARAGLNVAEGAFPSAPRSQERQAPVPPIPVYIPPQEERPSMQPLASYPALPSQPGSQPPNNMASAQNVPPSTQNLSSEGQNAWDSSSADQGQRDVDPSGGQS